MTVKGHRERIALKFIRIHFADLWQTVQLGPVSKKQAQWLMLQSCPVTAGVTE